MSVSIPTTEPELVYAGETVQWTKSFSDYPATSYTLKYYLSGPQSITLTASAYNTMDHLVSVTAAASVLWAYGIYSWVCYAEAGSGETLEKYRLGSGFLTVKTAAGKSHAKKMLDAIEAYIEGKRISDIVSHTIAGKSITKMSREDLLNWRRKYQDEYAAELANENRINGKSTSSKIRVRFRSA